MSVHSVLPHELLKVIEESVNFPPLELAKERLRYMYKWNCRARELEADEEALKKAMDPTVRKAVKNKRILLFKEMLVDCGYPDLDVVSELQDGADLIGVVPETGMLPKCFKPALLSREGLEKRAELVRPRIAATASSSGDAEVDKQVWALPMDEVKQGWLRGPLRASDVPSGSPVSRRFGLRPKDHDQVD